MPKRGFSLVELLIVVGVIVALGAVVSANMFGWAGEARFSEATRRVGSAFVMARADAQGTGRVLAVVARTGRGGVELVLEPFDPEADEVVGAGTAASRDRAPAGRRLMVLPAGVRITDRMPAAESEAAGVIPPAVENPSSGAGTALRMCVMLPDGGAWSSGPVFLVGPGYRAARVGVNRWTGTARIEVVEVGEQEEDEQAEIPAEGDKGERPKDGEGG